VQVPGTKLEPGIEENESSKLLLSQDVQCHTSRREHQNISPLILVTVNMFKKDRHTVMVNIKKIYLSLCILQCLNAT
jgi:hypothetical protein